jgi:hypothetical protein
VNLDRSILDREPEREDELKTMREQPDLEVEPDAGKAAATVSGTTTDGAKARPALASEDVS